MKRRNFITSVLPAIAALPAKSILAGENKSNTDIIRLKKLLRAGHLVGRDFSNFIFDNIELPVDEIWKKCTSVKHLLTCVYRSINRDSPEYKSFVLANCEISRSVLVFVRKSYLNIFLEAILAAETCHNDDCHSLVIIKHYEVIKDIYYTLLFSNDICNKYAARCILTPLELCSFSGYEATIFDNVGKIVPDCLKDDYNKGWMKIVRKYFPSYPV